MLKVIFGETRDDLLRIAINFPESGEDFRRIHHLLYPLKFSHNPLSSKNQRLDGPTVRSQEHSVRVCEEIGKAFRQIVRGLGQTVGAFRQNVI